MVLLLFSYGNERNFRGGVYFLESSIVSMERPLTKYEHHRSIAVDSTRSQTPLEEIGSPRASQSRILI